MKKIYNNNYFKWGLVAFAVIASSLLLYFFILRIDFIANIFKRIFIILKPLIYGIVIAFLLTQIFNYFKKVFNKLLSNKIKNHKKLNKISNVISIILSIIILLLILFFIFYILIPRLMISILGIIESWSINANNIEMWLRDILKVSPTLETIILNAVNDSSKSILEWMSEGLLPTMENIFSNVTTGLNGMYIFLKDFIIGIVFSVYLLIYKNKYIASLKKFIYTIFGISKANSILHSARYSYKIFNGFIKGKLFTSLIIGTACYIGMIILKMPYALLISLIIAVTNIIPFFGPIIGWVPGVILIAMVSPIQALYFTILIIILQQIEGNILEPKIVGDITGISGFWVLFAIIVFGDLFGFIGMILGVPVFAIIYHFIKYNADKYLSKRELPYNDDDYLDLKYIDETTKKPVKLKSSN